MTPDSASPQSSLAHLICRTLSLFAGIALLTVIIANQTTAQNPTQGFTPSGLKPGAPAGSYGLSGFDNINLYNGNLNFSLPLLSIGGRGNAKMPMMLTIDSVRWSIGKDSGEGWEIFYPDPNWWGGLRAGYGPGVLQGRMAMTQAMMNPMSRTTTTRLTFTAADGTEYELRDKLKNGQPYFNTLAPRTRGRIFVSADGTAATFISDTIIIDAFSPQSEYMYPVGYLFMADGTRYRIGELDGSKAGLVTKIRDRNGNELSFTYDADNRVSVITDSLNRQVSISYGLTSFNRPKHTYDEISYKGFGGVARAIKIWRTNLRYALRSDFTGVMTYAALFPGLGGSSATNYDPAEIASSVELPDGRTYELRYNPWGNLARVVLPTGGAIEYDYANNFSTEYIHRPVTERRVYIDGVMNTLEGKQVYSQVFTTSPTRTETTVKQYDATGTSLLAHSKHYFEGAPGPSQGFGLTAYAKWNEGCEYQTETLALNGTGLPILRRTEQTWQQSPDTGLPIWWGGGLSNGPTMNPRRVETVTTLMDSIPNKKAKQTAINPVTGAIAFDQYNNQTDFWETDYGDNAPGLWLRHTHTDYLTTNSVNGKSYDILADNGDPSNPNIANTVHIRRLAKEQLVYSVNPSTGADGSTIAHSKFYYDQWALYPYSDISKLDNAYNPIINPATYVVARGNLTRVSRWLDLPSSTWLNADVEYDVAGNIKRSIDGRGNATTFSYADCFGAPNGEAQTNTAPTELGAQQSYAFQTSLSNALSHVSYTQFDYYLGAAVDGKDINGVIASNFYTNAQGQTDLLDRPLRVVNAVSTSEQSQSSFSYNDAARIVTVTSDRDAYNDNLLKTETFYDKLGRTTETRAYESATAYITTKREYDAMGRIKRASSPYRTTSDPTYGWLTTRYDALGRVYEVETADGALVTSAYSNNTVTVTDQKGRQRRNVVDGLGRLTQVIEDPNGLGYQTNYTYDAVSNLRRVEQVQAGQGTQYRYFMYDSLARLLRARSPEQEVNTSITPTLTDTVTGQNAWSLAYTYDEHGNLETRVDPRNIITTYAYDALNRNTTATYSANANTPNVINRYDNASLAYGKGRLWQSETLGDEGTLTTINSFDSLGRVLSQSQQFKTSGTWSAAYTAHQTYRITGSINTQTYPSGHTTSYGYDTAGRLSSFTGNLGDGVSRSYSSAISYDEGGRMLEEQYGTQTALYHKLRYNIRGQLYDIRLSTLSRAQSINDWDRGCLAFYYSSDTHGGSSITNNGNLTKAESYVPNADGSYNLAQDRYEYDSLNRLQSVSEYQWGTQSIFTQAYTYDRWGNRQIDQTTSFGGVNELQFAVNTANNRLGVPSGQSGQMLYDAAGNLTTDTYSRGDTRTYDGENHLLTNTDGASVLSRYTYDSAGRRVRRTISSQQTWQVYGIGGELLAEYAANASPSVVQKEYGYRGAELLVTATSGAQVEWLIADHLGTPRMVADKTGSLAGVRRHDYLPFGEEIYAGTGGRTTGQGYVSDGVRQKFTKYERDAETNLDYAQARYFSSVQGRFTSADPLYFEMSRLNDPQQLNLYNYTRGNPLKYIDPSGYQIKVTGNNKQIYLQLLQMGLTAFNVDIQGDIVVIVDDKGMPLDDKALEALKATLKGDDLLLFEAITDKLNVGIIDTGGTEPDAKIFFANAKGKKRNTNYLDMFDIKMLDDKKNVDSGVTASSAVKHETLEVYYKVSKNLSADAAHEYVSKNTSFKGIDYSYTGFILNDAETLILGGFRVFTVSGKEGTMQVTMMFDKPISAVKPADDARNKAKITSIEFSKPKP